MQRRVGYHLAEIALVLGIVLFVILNSTLFFDRLDLTSTKAYTISEVSQNLFRELDNDVAVTYYLSDSLRRRVPEVQEIEDLLREYAAYARGRITVRTVDPIEEEVEEEVQSLGVVPQQFQVVEEGQQSFSSVYTGIVIEYLDRFETLPVVLDPRTIEYELTSTIREIVRDEPRSVGILVGRDSIRLEELYRLAAERLSRSFSVRQVQQGEPIPPDLTALFVLGHRDLDAYELYHVDQFLMRGNSVFFGADGVFVTISPNLTAETALPSPLLEMLRGYGFVIEPAIAMDERYKRIPITQRMGNTTVQSFEPYPQWVSIASEAANQDHPITARFSGLDLLWASPVGTIDGTAAEETAVPLVRTSPSAWTMGEPFVVSPLQSGAFRRNEEATRGQYELGFAYSGELTSFFADREPPAPDGRPELSTPPIPSTERARVIVMGDSDFASDYLQASDSAYNLTFLENTAEWLANDEDLLAIRTRTQRPMSLDRIQDPAARDRVGATARAVNVFVVPIALALAGVWRILRRRRWSQTRGTA